MKKRVLFVFIIPLIIFLLFYFTSCNGTKDTTSNVENSLFSICENDPSLLEKESFFDDSALDYTVIEGKHNKSIVLAVVGDIMVHSPQITSAYIESEGMYNFKECFSHITSFLQKADFVTGNLETTFAGTEYGYSGYPLFNSPPELAHALKESGFSLLFTANNHSMDRGEKGVVNTINLIEEKCLSFVGTARNQEERERGYILFQNDIRVAFFAYTYGTNGILLPSRKEYLVSLIDEQLIAKDINRAKNDLKADIVVIGLHWGEEYQLLPSGYQKELARKLVDMGADIIIGSHPHVIQPAEIIKTEKGEGLVFYSLGNFISNQRWRYSDSGVIVYIKIQLNPALHTSNVTILEIVPTWVHKYLQGGKWKYTVLPVREVLETENAKEIFKLSNQNCQRLKEVLEETDEIFWRFWPNDQSVPVDLINRHEPDGHNNG
jgi:poly-gamma-glutamate synthesis protein (capsule biosynthesis protein)